jgi:hypothetical protein
MIVAPVCRPWQYSDMVIRLGVASMGVAGFAYITSPAAALWGFVVLVAGPMVYHIRSVAKGVPVG